MLHTFPSYYVGRKTISRGLLAVECILHWQDRQDFNASRSYSRPGIRVRTGYAGIPSMCTARALRNVRANKFAITTAADALMHEQPTRATRTKSKLKEYSLGGLRGTQDTCETIGSRVHQRCTAKSPALIDCGAPCRHDSSESVMARRWRPSRL